MITVIKNNNNKRKRRKKTRKNNACRRDLNLGPLFPHYGFTTRPRELTGLHPAKSFDLNKTDVIFTVNTSKRFKTCKIFSTKKPEGKVSDRPDYHN